MPPKKSKSKSKSESKASKVRADGESKKPIEKRFDIIASAKKFLEDVILEKAEEETAKESSREVLLEEFCADFSDERIQKIQSHLLSCLTVVDDPLKIPHELMSIILKLFKLLILYGDLSSVPIEMTDITAKQDFSEHSLAHRIEKEGEGSEEVKRFSKEDINKIIDDSVSAMAEKKLGYASFLKIDEGVAKELFRQLIIRRQSTVLVFYVSDSLASKLDLDLEFFAYQDSMFVCRFVWDYAEYAYSTKKCFLNPIEVLSLKGFSSRNLFITVYALFISYESFDFSKDLARSEAENLGLNYFFYLIHAFKGLRNMFLTISLFDYLKILEKIVSTIENALKNPRFGDLALNIIASLGLRKYFQELFLAEIRLDYFPQYAAVIMLTKDLFEYTDYHQMLIDKLRENPEFLAYASSSGIEELPALLDSKIPLKIPESEAAKIRLYWQASGKKKDLPDPGSPAIREMILSGNETLDFILLMLPGKILDGYKDLLNKEKIKSIVLKSILIARTTNEISYVRNSDFLNYSRITTGLLNFSVLYCRKEDKYSPKVSLEECCLSDEFIDLLFSPMKIEGNFQPTNQFIRIFYNLFYVLFDVLKTEESKFELINTFLRKAIIESKSEVQKISEAEQEESEDSSTDVKEIEEYKKQFIRVNHWLELAVFANTVFVERGGKSFFYESAFSDFFERENQLAVFCLYHMNGLCPPANEKERFNFGPKFNRIFCVPFLFFLMLSLHLTSEEANDFLKRFRTFSGDKRLTSEMKYTLVEYAVKRFLDLTPHLLLPLGKEGAIKLLAKNIKALKEFDKSILPKTVLQVIDIGFKKFFLAPENSPKFLLLAKELRFYNVTHLPELNRMIVDTNVRYAELLDLEFDEDYESKSRKPSRGSSSVALTSKDSSSSKGSSEPDEEEIVEKETHEIITGDAKSESLSPVHECLSQFDRTIADIERRLNNLRDLDSLAETRRRYLLSVIGELREGYEANFSELKPISPLFLQIEKGKFDFELAPDLNKLIAQYNKSLFTVCEALESLRKAGDTTGGLRQLITWLSSCYVDFMPSIAEEGSIFYVAQATQRELSVVGEIYTGRVYIKGSAIFFPRSAKDLDINLELVPRRVGVETFSEDQLTTSMLKLTEEVIGKLGKCDFIKSVEQGNFLDRDNIDVKVKCVSGMIIDIRVCRRLGELEEREARHGAHSPGVSLGAPYTCVKTGLTMLPSELAGALIEGRKEKEVLQRSGATHLDECLFLTEVWRDELCKDWGELSTIQKVNKVYVLKQVMKLYQEQERAKRISIMVNGRNVTDKLFFKRTIEDLRLVIDFFAKRQSRYMLLLEKYLGTFYPTLKGPLSDFFPSDSSTAATTSDGSSSSGPIGSPVSLGLFKEDSPRGGAAQGGGRREVYTPHSRG